jgi:hypothetical protein
VKDHGIRQVLKVMLREYIFYFVNDRENVLVAPSAEPSALGREPSLKICNRQVPMSAGTNLLGKLM